MSRPPYPTYPGPRQQPPWVQQGQRPIQPGAASLPLHPPPPAGSSPAPPTTIKPEHAALYANYGYGARWQPPPPQQPMAPPLPPPQQYPSPMTGHLPTAYAQSPYAVHAYQAQPIMYIQPPQPLVQSSHPPHVMHAHQQYANHPTVPQIVPRQHVHHPSLHQPVANNPNNTNVQRFPPAKRPRFDNARPTSQLYSTSQPPNPSLPLPLPPLPLSGPTHNQSGRMSSQQPPFKTGRGGSVQSSRGRASGHHSRGGGNIPRGGLVNGTNNRAANASRGGATHGGSRGAFRNASNSLKPSNSSSSFTSGISSSSFNPQLPNGQSLANLNRPRHGHGLSGSRREESSKKTLTDFRVIGVDCPLLGWAWGTVIAQGDMDNSEAKSTRGSRAASPNSAAPEVGTESHAPSIHVVQSIAKPSQIKTSTESSRIRIYFNSPVELEDKPSQVYAPDRSRGGKRKKEADDGEPQESGKRKKEDPDCGENFPIPTKIQQQDSLFLNPASLHNPLALPGQESFPRSTFHESPSGIGAKRKATDDENTSVAEQINTAEPVSGEQEAETEYAGSPRRGDQHYYEGAPPSIHSLEMDENDDPIPESQVVTEPAYDDEQNPVIGPVSPMTESSEQKQDELEAAALLSESAASRTGTDGQGVEEEHAPGARTPEHGNFPTEKIDPHSDVGLTAEDEEDETLQEETQPIESTDASFALSVQSAGMFPTAAMAPTDGVTTPAPSVICPVKPPSPNRISISYAGSSRRLVLDAEIIQHVKIYRAEGKIEVSFVLERYEDPAATPANIMSVSELSQPAAESAEDNADTPTGEGGLKGYKMDDNGSSERSSDTVAVENTTLHEACGQAPAASSTDDTPEAESGHCDEKFISSSDATQVPSRCRETSKEYVPIAYPAKSADPTLPDFSTLLQVAPTVVNLTAYLDRLKPLSEPKWVRTGDIEEWLSAVFDSRTKKGSDAREVWSGKIKVTDPDPVIHTILGDWAASSGVGVGKNRRRFIKEHLTVSAENLFDILLRVVRGSMQPPVSSTSSLTNMSSLSGSPAIDPASSGSSMALMQSGHHTPLSAAILGLYQILAEYAKKAGDDSTKLFDHLGVLISTLPQHQLQRSIDWMFKDWAALHGINLGASASSSGGGGSGGGGGSNSGRKK
ncbi:uncharacterized protein EI90DRAFT_3157376 [Cantharellus anzutake]|uniref:uncharacterized protein n=1 Tax=Cantharellus anzutake TaxID=1750568 RepID=UPI0019063916|nr:uncharacterized protein EI90DRAFT_3157376 [Cantharellus anzutake]KAF8324468.1 hypothetical protein EI90DRAFT_3157376 [Cantharellus anzutake]